MDKKNHMMENEKISKLLAKMSIPAIIGMIVVALYNVVDTMYIGRGVGRLGIAALTITFPIQMLVMGIAQMLGVGSASIVSRALGEKDIDRANKAVGNTVSLGVIIALSFMAIGYLFLDEMLVLFGSDLEILPYAKAYMSVILAGVVFNTFSMVFNSLIRAEGHAKKAMYTMLVGTFFNVILDPIFIFKEIPLIWVKIPALGLGMKGAALATIISQLCSFIYALIFILSDESAIKIKFKNLAIKGKMVYEIVTVGSASLLRNFASTILGGVLNNALIGYGNIYLSIMGIVNKGLMFLFMPLFGIVQGLQPIVGYNYGAKKLDRVEKTLKLSTIAMTVILVFGTLVTQLTPDLIIRIFTDDAEIIQKGQAIMRIITIALPVIAIQIVSSGFYQSIGKAMPALTLALARQILLFIPLMLILPKIMGLGLMGIWLAYPISDIISTLISVVILKNEFNKMDEQIACENVVE